MRYVIYQRYLLVQLNLEFNLLCDSNCDKEKGMKEKNYSFIFVMTLS